MTNNQVWALIVGVVSLYGILTTVFILYINAKFDAVDNKITAIAADLKEHITTTMMEHLRLEHPRIGSGGE